jgi:choline kinase
MVGQDFTAVILAAGRGTRLASLTTQPKVLLDVGGQSLLARHLAVLRALGLRRVALVVGYQRHQVVAAAQVAGAGLDLQFVANDDYLTHGNGYSFYLGLRHAAGPVLAFDGDVIYEPEMLGRFLTPPEGDALLVGAGRLDDVECTKVLVDGDGFVRRTVEKRLVAPGELAQWRFVGESMGVLRFGGVGRLAWVAACERFFTDPARRLDNWEQILNDHLADLSLGYVLEPDPRWVEIDTPDDFARAVALYGSGPRLS